MSKIEKKQEISLQKKEAITKDQGEPTKAGICYLPTVDIFETSDTITLMADLPGVHKEQLDINVEDKHLTITGPVKENESRFQPLYTEYETGGFTRSFKLGDTIDQTKINATLKNGVLTLVLPKADRLKPRKIEIATS